MSLITTRKDHSCPIGGIVKMMSGALAIGTESGNLLIMDIKGYDLIKGRHPPITYYFFLLFHRLILTEYLMSMIFQKYTVVLEKTTFMTSYRTVSVVC